MDMMAGTRNLKKRKSGGDPGERLHAILRRAWITAAVMVAIFVLGLGADQVTATMCGACHEIAPQVATKANSGHSQLACPDCHEDSRPWYRFPETLVVRTGMLVRNLGPHLAYEFGGGASPLVESTVEIPDSKCLECHDPGREVTLHEGGVQIDHTEHAEANESCISCHRYTAHPTLGSDPELLFMSQCFQCHGLTEDAEAPGDCLTCHPDDYELLPETHAASEWQNEHGELAIEDRDLCLMCHLESVCTDCHGLDMPHPDGWEDGAEAHGEVVRDDRATCDQCHADTAEFCTTCHHESYAESKGTWVEQHPEAVEDTGAAECMRCHEPTFCVTCHTERGGPELPF